MKHLFIAGNWKSNKTVVESLKWMQKFSAEYDQIRTGLTDSTIVICVPYTALLVLKEQIDAKSLPVQLGAENVSPFKEGAETGEVSARMVRELADWVIVGHSERRKNFAETDDTLAQKVARAKEAGLKVIYCVPDEQTVVPAGIDVVAYEPVWAIGTGKTETAENANTVISGIKAKSQVATAIYGGSVTAENVAGFVAQPHIDGVLPGGASLNPATFARLIRAAGAVNTA